MMNLFRRLVRHLARSAVTALLPLADVSGKVERVGTGGRQDDDYRVGPANCNYCRRTAWLDTWGFCVDCLDVEFVDGEWRKEAR